MRIVLGVLVLANLAFFGWSHWIAPEPMPPADPLKPAVPRLMLARETARASTTGTPAGTRPSAAAPVAPPASAAGTAPATQTDVAAAAGAPIQCVTIGPFAVPEAASRAASAFRTDGYESVSRPVVAEVPDGFWVYVADVESRAVQRSLVQRLQDGGITDAREMPRTAAGLRISLGVFSERGRAARRAAAAGRLGVSAEVAEHTRPATVYFLDLRPRAGSPTLKPDEIAALNQEGGTLSVAPCPLAEGSAAQTPAGSSATAPHSGPADAPAASPPVPAAAPARVPTPRTASG